MGVNCVRATNCVYVLNPSAQNAFQATNGSTVALTGCGLAVDSSNGDAMTVNGGSSVTGSAIAVVGGAVVSNGGTTTPAPTTGTAAAADPLALVSAPTVGGCNYTNYSEGAGSWVLTQGVYCGGISLHNGAIATFSPGTYIINGGGLSLAGGTTTGSGVMFYLTGTNATYGSATISNGASVTLSAETSGPYMGVLFFQDRSITSAVNATFSGGATMQLTGTLYFPTTSVLVSNGASSNSVIAIVAAEVSFSGGTKLTWDSTGQKTGLFSDSVALLQ